MPVRRLDDVRAAKQLDLRAGRMSALICGSIAYDTVMVFHGRFNDHILPDRIHMLNVSFLVPSHAAQFRRLRGQHRLQPQAAGRRGRADGDGRPRLRALRATGCEKRGVDRTHVREVEDEYTAQAFITTDLDDNQITAFHPGAMNHSHLNRVPTTRASRSASWRRTAARA